MNWIRRIWRTFRDDKAARRTARTATRGLNDPTTSVNIFIICRQQLTAIQWLRTTGLRISENNPAGTTYPERGRLETHELLEIDYFVNDLVYAGSVWIIPFILIRCAYFSREDKPNGSIVK